MMEDYDKSVVEEPSLATKSFNPFKFNLFSANEEIELAKRDL